MDYWRDNAYKYDWLSEQAKKNYTEFDTERRKRIKLHFRMIHGHPPDMTSEEDARIIYFTAFLIRFTQDYALYIPPIVRIEEPIEVPSGHS